MKYHKNICKEQIQNLEFFKYKPQHCVAGVRNINVWPFEAIYGYKFYCSISNFLRIMLFIILVKFSADLLEIKITYKI